MHGEEEINYFYPYLNALTILIKDEPVQTCVFWDWNGTILNDVEVNCSILNRLLYKRGLKSLSLNEYREVFRMPILEFYKDIGFQFINETFDDIAAEYFYLYQNEFGNVQLTKDIEYVLQEIQKKHCYQYIISATPQHELIEQVDKFKLGKYFTEIVGNDNYKVASKKHRAIELMKRIGGKNNFLFIGDMDHDHEVAKSINAKCILYSRGHQRIRKSSEYILVEEIEDVLNYL